MVLGAPASETALGITLGRGVVVPPNSFVRIRGLSPQMALTEGHVIAPGAWAVPLSALSDLRLKIPAAASGRLDVSVAVVAIDGGVVAEAKTTLVVAPAALAPSVATRPSDEARFPPRGAQSEALAAPTVTPRSPASVAALPPPKTPEAPPPAAAQRNETPLPPPLPPAARERSEGFVARGRILLEEGNVASARLFFRRAADEGLADGALALGGTFDPAELERLHAIGIRPDPAEARRWYERARELGAGAAAERRLDKLGSR